MVNGKFINWNRLEIHGGGVNCKALGRLLTGGLCCFVFGFLFLLFRMDNTPVGWGDFGWMRSRGAPPFTVTITATNLTSGNDCASGNCFMNFEGTQQQNTYTHTYSTPGTFTLSVLYQNTGSDDIVITVLNNISLTSKFIPVH